MTGLAVRADTVVTVSDDRTARVWTLPELTGVRTLPQEGYGTAAAVSPDGKRIAVGSTAGLEIWDVTTWRRVHQAPLPAVSIAWEGAILALAIQNSPTVVLLDGGTFVQRGEIKGHHDSVHDVALSGDGANLLSGSGDRTARMWDTGSGEQLQVYLGHRGAVLAVALGPTGVIATGSSDKSAIVWHAVSGEPVLQFAGHKDWVTAVQFDPAGNDVLYTSSRDATVRRWDLSNGASLGVIEPEFGPIDAAWVAGESLVVAGETFGRTAIPDDVGTRKPVRVREPRLDKRCAPVVACAIARFDADQMEPSAAWSLVSQARELSATDPRSCIGLEAELEAIAGPLPPACTPTP